MKEHNFQEEVAALRDFLIEYPEASWRPATTMYVNYISLLKPVGDLFGAEYQCHPDTYKKLKDMEVV